MHFKWYRNMTTKALNKHQNVDKALSFLSTVNKVQRKQIQNISVDLYCIIEISFIDICTMSKKDQVGDERLEYHSFFIRKLFL